ncbi:hypothetical protein [Nocardioides sp. YIM 152588]|uniref:hypothetical protein n=1 Tax=Nocardioides sp. YIM 152588 TaxID=3158259 RepID=UPI0032E522B3
MRKHTKVIGFIGTLGLTAALIGAAVEGTGAYFQDSTADATISGTMGSIQIEGQGDLNPVFQDILPGETRDATIQYSNTGDNAQDVWIHFDPDDLGDGLASTDTRKVNDGGRYVEIVIKGNGGTTVFASDNLNDDFTPGHCTAPASLVQDVSGNAHVCNPLVEWIKVADGLSPGQWGDFNFSYKSASKTGNGDQGAPIYGGPQGIGYQLVATQPGVAPDAAGDYA